MFDLTYDDKAKVSYCFGMEGVVYYHSFTNHNALPLDCMCWSLFKLQMVQLFGHSAQSADYAPSFMVKCD